MKHAFHILFVALCLQLAGGVANTAPVYSFQYIPFTGVSLNDLGQVAGLQLADANHGLYQPLLFSNGVVTPLGPNLTQGPIVRLNNTGQAIDYRGIYQNGTYTTIPGFSPLAINDAGTIFGVVGRNQAALYQDGDITVLNGFMPESIPNINQQGEIAGSYIIGAPSGGEGLAYTHAFLYSHGLFTDISSPDCRYSGIDALNNRGQAVGGNNLLGPNTCSAPNSFLYQDGVTTALPGFQSVTGINDAGQILGTRGVVFAPAILLKDGDVVYDVAALIQGATQVQASISPACLNNAGQILFQGTINSQKGSFLLTPVPASTIPEPLSSGLLGLGFVFLVIASKIVPWKQLAE